MLWRRGRHAQLAAASPGRTSAPRNRSRGGHGDGNRERCCAVLREEEALRKRKLCGNMLQEQEHNCEL